MDETEDGRQIQTSEKRAAMSRHIAVVLLVTSFCAFPAAWFFFKRIKHTAFFYVAPPSLALGNIPLMVTAVAYQRLFKFLCAIAALKIVPGNKGLVSDVPIISQIISRMLNFGVHTT